MDTNSILNTTSNIVFGNTKEVENKDVLVFLQSCLLGCVEDFNKNNFESLLSFQVKDNKDFVREFRKILCCAFEYNEFKSLSDTGVGIIVQIGDELSEGDYDWTQYLTINNVGYSLKGIYNKRTGSVIPYSQGYTIVSGEV